MEKIKKIELVFKLGNKEDEEMYDEIVKFAKKHNIQDESSALKSFIKYLHFLGADMLALSDKLKVKDSPLI